MTPHKPPSFSLIRLSLEVCTSSPHCSLPLDGFQHALGKSSGFGTCRQESNSKVPFPSFGAHSIVTLSPPA